MTKPRGPFLPVQHAAPAARAALELIQGESQKPPVKVGFGIGKLDRNACRMPPGVFLVTTSRPRKPYVLDLLLYGSLMLIRGEVDPAAPPALRSIHVHPPETLTAKSRKRCGLPSGFEFVLIVASPLRRWGRWVHSEAVKP